MIDKAILKLAKDKAAAVRMIAIAVVFAILQAVATIGQAFGLTSVIVNLWEGGKFSWEFNLWEGSDFAWWAVLLFTACFILREALRIAEESITDAFAARLADAAQTQLLEDIFYAGPTLTKMRGSATLVANATEDITCVEAYARIAIKRPVDAIIIPLALLVALFATDWVSGLIALVGYPFIMLFMRLIGQTAKERANARHAEFEQMSNSFVDISRGVDTLKAFGQSRSYSSKIYAASENFREITMKTLKTSMLSSTVLDLFATLALATVAIMLGFRMVDSAVAFFPALVVLMLIPEYFTPIREFGADYHATLDGKTALANIDAIHTAVVKQAWQDERITLPDFAFSTEQHIVGIFGKSGAGKSTLLDILAGFSEPTEGKIIVDGTARTTLREVEWQRRVAYIPQNPCIFHASLRENLTFYNPDATDSEIEDALRALGMLDFARTLRCGLDTKIGEGGLTLSGGEAQRVALARTLLDPSRDIWVLDEPTAHLDIETELELKEHMLPLMKGKLVFLATHRRHWEGACDEVFDLDAPEDVLEDSPEVKAK